MRFDPRCLPEAAAELLAARHLATLSTLRRDGSPQVTPVGFTFDATNAMVRIITSDSSQKVRNVERRAYAAVCQVNGAQWLTLEGPASITRRAADVREAEQRYAGRYREPRPNSDRVVIVIKVTRCTGSVRG